MKSKKLGRGGPDRLAARARWTAHLEGWEQSGLSQAEYCRREKLDPATLGRWKKKLSPRGPGHGGREGFVELASPAIRRPLLELTVDGKGRASLRLDFDLIELRRSAE